MLKDHEDAFGHEIYDYHKGIGGSEIIERDDDYFDVSGGPNPYFSEYENWPTHQQQAMEHVRGRVLDIGCGAGRHSLYLQEQGFEVVSVDNSPLAIEVCRSKGLRNAQVLSITQITSRLGVFDSIVMLGNNFGLFGSFKRARWLLARFHRITSHDAMIIAETRDPYDTDTPEHLEYHQFNRQRGRMGGQVRIRVRYKKYVTPWFDYLLASKEEMEEILDSTGWVARDFLDSQIRGLYIAIFEKKVA